MHPNLKLLFEKIEKQRESVLTVLSKLSHEQLNARPHPEKWSASEILSHLITAERMSLNYMKKKIQGVEEARDTGMLEELKMLALKVSQNMPGLKFRAPRSVVENTILYQDLASIEKEWTALRKELYEFLSGINERHVNRKIYKHARAGYLNVKHALVFFHEHIVHHTPQIKKILHDKV